MAVVKVTVDFVPSLIKCFKSTINYVHIYTKLYYVYQYVCMTNNHHTIGSCISIATKVVGHIVEKCAIVSITSRKCLNAV